MLRVVSRDRMRQELLKCERFAHLLQSHGPIDLCILGLGTNGHIAMNSENIVALCDVDSDYAAKTFNKYPRAKRYQDFRQMLEQEKGIDAVVVGTPGHLHAVVSSAALKEYRPGWSL